MTYPTLGTRAVDRGTLVVTIACLYAGAVVFNNKLQFPWLGFDNFWGDTLTEPFGRVVGTFTFLAVSL